MASEVSSLGVRGAYFAIGNLQNSEKDSRFELLRKAVIEHTLDCLSAESIENDPVLIGFRELHNAVGRSNTKNVSSPESLLQFLLEKKALPRINLIVDIYNVISIKTRLALGAHNISNISGGVHLRLTNGNEKFMPLGSTKEKTLGPGEYAYVDDDNDVLCRLETRQVEKTKVNLDTTECFYIVQGNLKTSDGEILAAAEELISLTTEFCGGTVKRLLMRE